MQGLRPSAGASCVKRPLSVVDNDQAAIISLLSLHALTDPRILDVTHNSGRMWAGVPYTPTRSDYDQDRFDAGEIDMVADCRKLPVDDGSYDVLVFDPPHQADGGKTALGGGWAKRYGTGKGDPAELYEPFMIEAYRVLAANGIVLAKLSDQVHGGKYRPQHIWLIQHAQTHGFTFCDLMIRVAKQRAGLIDPKWKIIAHVRQIHTYWLVFRKGGCYSPNPLKAGARDGANTDR